MTVYVHMDCGSMLGVYASKEAFFKDQRETLDNDLTEEEMLEEIEEVEVQE